MKRIFHTIQTSTRSLFSISSVFLSLFCVSQCYFQSVFSLLYVTLCLFCGTPCYFLCRTSDCANLRDFIVHISWILLCTNTIFSCCRTILSCGKPILFYFITRLYHRAGNVIKLSPKGFNLISHRCNLWFNSKLKTKTLKGFNFI